MALIVIHDIEQKRDRIINTDFIFHALEEKDTVRIVWAQGSTGRDHCIVAGSLDEFAARVAAIAL